MPMDAEKNQCIDNGKWNETDLRIAVKKAGGIWRPRQKLWELSSDAVRALGIAHRVVE